MFIRFSVRTPQIHRKKYLFIYTFFYMLLPLSEISGHPFRENYVLLNNLDSFSIFCEVDQIRFMHVVK